MSRVRRTFVALRCSASLARRLRRVCEHLAETDAAFRAPTTDDFHVTVQFLGDTDEDDLAGIGRALEEAARTVAPLDLVYRGLGAFPEPERARIVWVGAEAPDAPDALERLAGAVGQGLAPLGYPPESRRFHPHVTLGRVRRRPSPALVEAVRAGRDRELGHEGVSDLKLILSEPGDRGYRYIDLTTVALGRA